jgi:hypothetical protein
VSAPLPPIASGVVSGEALRSFMLSFVREWLPRYLAEFAVSDLQIRVGEGVPTTSAPEGTLYIRTDIGRLYVREGGAWVAK